MIRTVRTNDDLIERLARAVHECYLAEQVRDGLAMGATPAMAPWRDLDEDKREANRAQARDIEAKLATIGCSVAAATRADGSFEFTDEEVEILAREEQRRWTRQRLASGWSYGPTRDDKAKRHPSLVSWDQLSESERDKDRDAVRNIPVVLARAGLRPRRSRS